MSEFIQLHANVVPPEVCRAAITRFEADPRKHPGQIVGARTQGKRSVDLGLRTLPEWLGLCEQLDVAVNRSIERYRATVDNFRDIHRSCRDTGYLMQRYLPNASDGFDWHADVATRESATRILAMVMYLNTVEVGGSTEFRAQQRAIAPTEGSVLWFPPGFEYVHRGTTPISGPKYIITSFLVYP